MDTKEINSITLPLSYLEEVTGFVGRSLVGKLLKRFEIIENRDILKAESRELVYEELRRLTEILCAFEQGRILTAFEFKRKEK